MCVRGSWRGSSPRGRGKRVRQLPDRPPKRLIPARAGKTNGPTSMGRTRAAHPRAGGENPSSCWHGWAGRGSSPRGRGKPGDVNQRSASIGLIPARAGKTDTTIPVPSASTAHPRAGGENPRSTSPCRRGGGSSPRGRGKRVAVFYGLLLGGLIPARAGKTEQKARGCPSWTAHPRAGGENTRAPLVEVLAVGSSPRGRGKPPLGYADARCFGLIPARAGKTWDGIVTVFKTAAHPRAGGENPIFEATVSTIDGSSPRGRGKQRPHQHGTDEGRLIPARAGKTQSRPSLGFSSEAHPRAGGENLKMPPRPLPGPGSSPRGRGKPVRRAFGDLCPRLIPARAGKTCSRSQPKTPASAHPRAGGENLGCWLSTCWFVGSSPRGRGKLPNLPTHSLTYRLIPARAGKTMSMVGNLSVWWAHPRAGGENSLEGG